MDAVGYDVDQLGVRHWAVLMTGMWAEVLLPLALVLGVVSRLAALGMIGFVAVQSATDIVGHGLRAENVGKWLDRVPDAVIADRRPLWTSVLLVVVFRGGAAVGRSGDCGVGATVGRNRLSPRALPSVIDFS